MVKKKNTSFFYRTANAHRRMNTIKMLKLRGEILGNREEVQEETVTFYKNIYLETEDWRGIKSYAGDKAPGLDGCCIFSVCVDTLSNLI